MMKETTPLVKPLSSSFHAQIPVYVKLVFLFLSLALAIFLFSSRSVDYFSSSLQVQTTSFANNSNDHVSKAETPTEFDSQVDGDTDPLQVVEGSPLPSSSINEVVSTDHEAKTKCDLFKGDWVPNPNGAMYNNNTCPFIEPQQDCMKNGRPDSGYLFWRWKPRDCELPKFDPERFLNLMRNKEFAFIGDSIPRNQAQSLLCYLSQVEQPVENMKVKHQATYLFPSYNFTLIGIWTPYLIKADIVEDSNGDATPVDIKLHLDVVDELWTKQYSEFDYLIIGGGPWFTRTTIFHENNTVQGCNRCPGRNLTDLGFGYSYRKALNRVFKFIIESSHKPQVLFSTITPSHFEHGKWNDGGNCNRIEPVKEDEASLSERDRTMYEIGVQEYDNAINNGASENGAFFKLLDTTRLSSLRPDGHPGAYRNYYPFAKDKNATVQNDCLHWCLPGPVDTWNELMLELLTRG
ncbi:hypothetical protein vseg_013563 [Gypsophila vaccaria]